MLNLPMPTPAQIEAGQRAASELYDAAVENALGDRTNIDWSSFRFPDIVKAYLNGEIDSAGIYLAMEIAKDTTGVII